jgi:hypothetical protein
MTAGQLLLLDERARPTLRQRVGELLSSADEAAFAVARIRLGVLDLSDREVGGIRRCRVLLGQLDAATLLDAAEESKPGGPRGAGAALAGLLRFAVSGRLEVRSAGLAAWSPDFGVVDGRPGRIGLLGSIQFGSPELIIGPAFTAVSADAAITGRLLERFNEMWDASHDVLPAIREVLERAYGARGVSASGRGEPDPG